jgi:hypothetical protein
MGLKDEKKVIQGDATKDRTYSSENTFADEAEAGKEFRRSVEKLFMADRWSDLPGLNSTFELYDARGARKAGGRVAVGDHIKIILPGVPLDNWVVVTDVKEEGDLAEYTTSPTQDPNSDPNDQQVKHFFIEDATSTFRVERQGKTIKAWEIGKTEGINNQGEDAGKRGVINTLIAEGGWAGFQRHQWEKVTDFLVHKIEIDK